MLGVPLLTPRLSSYLLSLVTMSTPQPRESRDSMSNEVVVTDHPIAEIVPATPMGYDTAVREHSGSDRLRANREHQPTRRMIGRARGIVRPGLIDKVDRDHLQPDAAFLRRRIVVAITLAVGATLLGFSFSVQQGDPAFYALTFGLAATWTFGSLLSGPLHMGHILLGGTLRRPIVTPIVTGLLLARLFVVGALIVLSIPTLATSRKMSRLRRLGISGSFHDHVVTASPRNCFFVRTLRSYWRVHPLLISTILYAVGNYCRWQSCAGLRGRCSRHRCGAAAPSLRRRTGTHPHPHHMVAQPAVCPAADLRRNSVITGRPQCD